MVYTMAKNLSADKFLFSAFVILITVNTISANDKWGKGHVIRNSTQDPDALPEWDPNGYVFFCLCMGRTGNQMDHFLGGLAFAKRLNRTLVLPPFRTYRNIRFTEWFKLEPLAEYHRVILAEDFLEYLAPEYWPPEDRVGLCFALPSSKEQTKCEMKHGNPFGPFWDGLGVDFAHTENVYISYREKPQVWDQLFPVSKYPVLALKGAPARFPVASEDRKLQQYLQASDYIAGEAQDYIDKFIGDQAFIGIHLRNGVDWAHACQATDGVPNYMASPQCLENTGRRVSQLMCFPTDQEIFRLLRKMVESTGISAVFVATDKRPMINEIEQELSDKNVKVYHADPHLPLVDMTILTHAEHFIGNCISSFTAYVTRARNLAGKPTSFWGFS